MVSLVDLFGFVHLFPQQCKSYLLFLYFIPYFSSITIHSILNKRIYFNQPNPGNTISIYSYLLFILVCFDDCIGASELIKNL